MSADEALGQEGLPVSRVQLLADRLRWLSQRPGPTSLDAAREICGNVPMIISFLDELVEIKRQQK